MEASIYSFFTFAASLSTAWEGRQIFWVDSWLNREYKEKIAIFSFVKKSPKVRGLNRLVQKIAFLGLNQDFLQTFSTLI